MAPASETRWIARSLLDCPLPNGYAITMSDVTDHAWVYNPKTQTGELSEQDDSVAGVAVVQVAGRHTLGGADSHEANPGSDIGAVDSYFNLDNPDGKKDLVLNDRRTAHGSPENRDESASPAYRCRLLQILIHLAISLWEFFSRFRR